MSPPSADDAERGTSDEEEGLNRASVTELWRFPVKSMGGVQVGEVRVDRRGVHADRLWAVRDLDNDITATARKLPALLGCTARNRRRVPSVVITFPGGAEIDSSNPGIHQRLSEFAGRDARLVALPPADDTRQHRLSVE